MVDGEEGVLVGFILVDVVVGGREDGDGVLDAVELGDFLGAEDDL